ncbi:hypothetical protein PT974_08112 [Cladobotryum mycophilum]|uniref:SSCRP protein n=1 Tax=Cladobotryum mycophilum TaxID=491253 RepID=A0ABR0SDH9_9HYPO
MQFFAIISAAAALMASANAAFIPRNIHVADFRVYSGDDCFTGNLGVWTVIDDDFTNGQCKSLNADYKSLSLTDINKGCTFTAYESDDCKTGATVLTVAQCSKATDQFKAWSITCGYKQ